MEIDTKIRYTYYRNSKFYLNVNGSFAIINGWTANLFLKIFSTLNWTFNCKITNGLRSNFRLPKWKLRKNKHHCIIKLDFVDYLELGCFWVFSFEVTAGTMTFKAKLRKNLGQFWKKFHFSVGRLQITNYF